MDFLYLIEIRDICVNPIVEKNMTFSEIVFMFVQGTAEKQLVDAVSLVK